MSTAHPEEIDVVIGDTIHVHDKMQRGYSYTLVAAPGRSFDPAFKPALTPAPYCGRGVASL